MLSLYATEPSSALYGFRSTVSVAYCLYQVVPSARSHGRVVAIRSHILIGVIHPHSDSFRVFCRGFGCKDMTAADFNIRKRRDILCIFTESSISHIRHKGICSVFARNRSGRGHIAGCNFPDDRVGKPAAFVQRRIKGYSPDPPLLESLAN